MTDIITATNNTDFSLIALLPNGRVDARKLYKFLELAPAVISRWLTSKIINNEYALQNEDYWGFNIIVEGNLPKTYLITKITGKGQI